MKTVYLDQNKWIDLARASHGKDCDPGLNRTLNFIRDASQRGSIAVPLSAVHYMETARIGNRAQRARLGLVMLELSCGYTLASYHDIVCHELEMALARHFPSVSPSGFNLLSKGFAHAFGKDYPDYQIPQPDRSRLPETTVRVFEAAAQCMIEKAVITGEGLNEIMPRLEVTPQNYQFKEHLETLHPRISQLPSVQRDDALYAISLADILNPLNEVLERHGLSGRDLDSFGREGLKSLIEELPSRQIEIQLHRQVIKNPQMKHRITDLEDWSGLGPAAAYCDVVVCEKHFADLVLRDGFCPKAQIITDLNCLPEMDFWPHANGVP